MYIADHKLHDTLFCDHAGCPRLMAKMESVDSVLSLEVSIDSWDIKTPSEHPDQEHL